LDIRPAIFQASKDLSIHTKEFLKKNLYTRSVRACPEEITKAEKGRGQRVPSDRGIEQQRKFDKILLTAKYFCEIV
jgi:hypothetical protein